MLRDEDLREDRGRASSGSFVRLVHVPTGIERWHSGPLQGVNLYELRQRWLAEIESEILTQGITQHIVPDHAVKSKRQRKR